MTHCRASSVLTTVGRSADNIIAEGIVSRLVNYRSWLLTRSVHSALAMHIPALSLTENQRGRYPSTERLAYLHPQDTTYRSRNSTLRVTCTFEVMAGENDTLVTWQNNSLDLAKIRAKLCQCLMSLSFGVPRRT